MKRYSNMQLKMQQHSPRNGFLLIVFSTILFCSQSSFAHFITIDQHEFRSSGYPQPQPPPPPPLAAPPPPQHLFANRELTPVELMVDLTNELTYRLLHYHSILNRNNFAFSPSALMSVLVALYEGSAGRSAAELKNVLLLPNTRDIIRIGYRDIHRRLRTYFFGSDNPLKGLSLNKDNVTITRQYEAILMFYGYDLGMDMVSSTVAPTTTTTTTTTTSSTTSTATAPTATTTTTTTATPTTTISTSSSTVNPTTTPTTGLPETMKETVMTTTIAALIDSTTSSTTPELTTTTSTTPELTTTTSTTPITTTSTTEAPATTTPPPTTTVATTEAPPTETTTTATSAALEESTTVTAPETTTTTGTAGSGSEGEAAELVSAFVAEEVVEPFQRIQKARVSRLPSGKLLAPLVPFPAPRNNYLPTSNTNNNRGVNGRRLSVSGARNKRHLLGYKDMDANLFVSLFPQSHDTTEQLHPESASSISDGEFAVEEVLVEPHLLVHGGNVASAAIRQNYNTDVISHVFYLGQQQLIHTTFKVYNAVLYYKYFDHLHMSVLELELDTPEYNLMILLPDPHVDLVAAAASLRLGPTLRIMRKQLTPKWVQAIIPDFRLHGTMFLTNDLQNMGICDIFEPNRADFHPMTNEGRIYVKHIEQSINVNIRTRPINQLKRNYGTQTQPIQISVSHPFLFFVIDRELDVAVMSGRVLNPQNVRIQ